MPTEALLMSIPCHADTPACQARSPRPPKRKPRRRGQSDNAPTLDWPDHTAAPAPLGISHVGIMQDQHGDIGARGTRIEIRDGRAVGDPVKAWLRRGKFAFAQTDD